MSSERRKVGATVTWDFPGRDGYTVSATAFFIRGRLYELTFSSAPHWLAQDVHFERMV
jgi:hypothetical protein